jgi:hypothetical protein
MAAEWVRMTDQAQGIRPTGMKYLREGWERSAVISLTLSSKLPGFAIGFSS